MKETKSTTIGGRIRLYRRAGRMTQRQLAGKLGLDRTSISAYEHSKRIPDIFILCHLADIFAVSLDELVGRDWEQFR